MNSAYLKMMKKQERQDVVVSILGWSVLTVGAAAGAVCFYLFALFMLV